MPKKTSITGSELFIVDNSEEDWKVVRHLHDWCQLSRAIDIATGYFEIGALLALKDEWRKVDKIRILMGDEVAARSKDAFQKAVAGIQQHLDDSIEAEKEKNDFLAGDPAIVEALKTGRIECRVYRKDKFHAKAYITHARMEVVGSSALVGSSNFTHPSLTENIELNVHITGGPVSVLQEWYEAHWAEAEDVTPEIVRVIERHVREWDGVKGRFSRSDVREESPTPGDAMRLPERLNQANRTGNATNQLKLSEMLAYCLQRWPESMPAS